MELIDVISNRYSVRKYKNIPVEEEKLLKILNAGRLAPSAVNFQPWYFIVINEPVAREKFNQVYERNWFKSAPVVIVVCADHSQSWKRSYDSKDFADVDAAIATDHLALMATNLGLGTCWVCHFDTKKCSSLLKLPTHIEPLALLPLGYPDGDEPLKNRKNLKDIVGWNKFE